MQLEFLIIYFVSLGICSLSTIYKTTCFKSMLCRQIIGNMFWSLVPVVNTFKAMLWLVSLLIHGKRLAQQRINTHKSTKAGRNRQ